LLRALNFVGIVSACGGVIVLCGVALVVAAVKQMWLLF